MEKDFQQILRNKGDYEMLQSSAVYKEKNLETMWKMASELD